MIWCLQLCVDAGIAQDSSGNITEEIRNPMSYHSCGKQGLQGDGMYKLWTHFHNDIPSLAGINMPNKLPIDDLIVQLNQTTRSLASDLDSAKVNLTYFLKD